VTASDPSKSRRVYLPEKPSGRALAIPIAAGVAIGGGGIAILITTAMGMPLQWEDGGDVPAWLSTLVGVLFTLGGAVLVRRRDHAVVDPDRRVVYAWARYGWFRRRFPLDRFDRVVVERVIIRIDGRTRGEAFELWLRGATEDGEVFLAEWGKRAAARDAAHRVAEVAGIPVEETTRTESTDDG
jgi:hypothetical protein